MTTISSSTSTSNPQQSVQASEVYQTLTTSALEAIREISSDNARRCEGCLADIELLSSGIFLKDQYRKLLESINAATPAHPLKAGIENQLAFFYGKKSFIHGHVSSEHFEVRVNRSNPTRTTFFFVCRRKITAHDALDSLTKELTLLSSAEICQIAYYKALESLFGTEKFDFLFDPVSPTPLTIGINAPCNPLFSLTARTYAFPLQPAELITIQQGIERRPVVTLFAPDETFFGFDPQASEEILSIQFFDIPTLIRLINGDDDQVTILMAKSHVKQRRAHTIATHGPRSPRKIRDEPKTEPAQRRKKAQIRAKQNRPSRAIRLRQIIQEYPAPIQNTCNGNNHKSFNSIVP